jgi:hypothetical protein
MIGTSPPMKYERPIVKADMINLLVGITVKPSSTLSVNSAIPVEFSVVEPVLVEARSCPTSAHVVSDTP